MRESTGIKYINCYIFEVYDWEIDLDRKVLLARKVNAGTKGKSANMCFVATNQNMSKKDRLAVHNKCPGA